MSSVQIRPPRPPLLASPRNAGRGSRAERGGEGLPFPPRPSGERHLHLPAGPSFSVGNELILILRQRSGRYHGCGRSYCVRATFTRLLAFRRFKPSARPRPRAAACATKPGPSACTRLQGCTRVLLHAAGPRGGGRGRWRKGRHRGPWSRPSRAPRGAHLHDGAGARAVAGEVMPASS